MAPKVLDIVAVLPAELRRRACTLSDRLADDMGPLGCASHFRLGQPGETGSGESYEPHVSIFMLTVDEFEIEDIIWTTRRVAAALPALTAEGERYQHNPVGAPELCFRKTVEWTELQRAVIAEVEPLRRGRLRETDPCGDRILDVLSDPHADADRRDQLARFGYDEVHDRFNPHITLAWPTQPTFRIGLDDLPPPSDFSGVLSELAVYGMGPHGTCTTRYGMAPLKSQSLTPNALR